jgi:hypothetical protein
MAVFEGVVSRRIQASPHSKPHVACHPDRRTRHVVRKIPSPGKPLPIHVDKVDIKDGIPSDRELREVVKGLQNSRAAGASGLKAEHIKVWLSDVVRKEEVGVHKKNFIFSNSLWTNSEYPISLKSISI